MPRPRWIRALKAIALSIAFFLLGFAVMGLLLWYHPFLSRPRTQNELLQVQSAAMLGAFGLVTWFVGMRGAGLTRKDLRYPSRTSDVIEGVGGGFLLGAVPAVLALTLAVPIAGARWQHDAGGIRAFIGALADQLVVLAPAALAEEIAFRGVALVLLAAAFGRSAALVIMAVVFAVVHVHNPDVTPLAIGNIAVAGMLLGVAFYLPGGICTAFGCHLGWNFAIAALDAPVSGIGSDMPLIDYSPGSPLWLSGAAFGPEGGLLATLTLAAAAVLAARHMQVETT